MFVLILFAIVQWPCWLLVVVSLLSTGAGDGLCDGDLAGLVDGLVDHLLALLGLCHLPGHDAVLARYLDHGGADLLLGRVDRGGSVVLGLDHGLHLSEGLHLGPVDGGIPGGGHHLCTDHLLGHHLSPYLCLSLHVGPGHHLFTSGVSCLVLSVDGREGNDLLSLHVTCTDNILSTDDAGLNDLSYDGGSNIASVGWLLALHH